MPHLQFKGFIPLSCLLLWLLSGFHFPFSEPETESAPRVTIDSGALEGKRYGSEVEMFLGIPYAAPPIGNLRWKPPAPAARWSVIREAKAFGATCPQSEEAVRNINEEAQEYSQIYPFYGTFRADEDCLSLNIWTTSAVRKTKLPVMAWIHGGGGNSLTGALPPYGPVLARKGVVLVAPNFRIGLLGRMAHPALTAESAHHASGNYGLLDQIAALQWIQRNIEQFGGDRNNVTIFGHSDGASQVCYLMISPLAHGLFHRAILQGEECRDIFVPELARRVDWDYSPGGHGGTAHEGGRRLAQDLKIPDGPDTLAQLRSKRWQEIVEASEKDENLTAWAATVDGWVLPEQPAFAFRNGHQARVPVMLGSTEDESVLMYNPPVDPSTVPSYKETLKTERFFSHAEDLFQAYPANTDADVKRAYLDLLTDDTAQGAYHFARAMTAAGQKAYLYYFTYPPKGKYAGLRAYHGLELRFIAGVFRKSRWGEPDAQDMKLAEIMSAYWAQFAKTGDPHQNGLPAWPRYDPDAERCLEIGLEVKPRTIPHLDKFAAFERSLEARIAEYQKSGSTEKEH
jgi:para-nitrobenzyl esterase